MVKDQAISKYCDSLVKGPNDQDLESCTALTAKAKAAVTSAKTRLHAKFDWMLGIEISTLTIQCRFLNL